MPSASTSAHGCPTPLRVPEPPPPPPPPIQFSPLDLPLEEAVEFVYTVVVERCGSCVLLAGCTYMYIQGSVQKDCLLQHVVRWRERLLQGVEEEGLSSSPPSWTRDMEQWLSGVRLDGVELSTSSSGIAVLRH